MPTDKHTYDLIFSLGGNCSAAGQLRRRGLRLFSLPFDWVCSKDARPMEYLCEGFSDGFKNLALKENLKRVEWNKEHPIVYQDSYSGYCFPNHFKHSFEEQDEYPSFHETLRKRCDRLFEKIGSAKTVLCVFSGEVEVEIDCIRRLEKTLKAVFPETVFHFEIVQFNAGQNSVEEFGNIRRRKWERPVNIYDFQQTNFEWAFMDDLCVPRPPRKKGFDGLLYKIWKHLGKRLKKKGILINEF